MILVHTNSQAYQAYVYHFIHKEDYICICPNSVAVHQ